MSTLIFLLACTHAGAPSPSPTSAQAVPSAHAIRVDAPGIDGNYAGTWGGDTSTAVYRFGIDGNQLWMEAWDSGDGEWFDLDQLGYADGIFVITTMPSTNWTLQNSFRLRGSNQMIQQISGAATGEFDLGRVTREPTRE